MGNQEFTPQNNEKANYSDSGVTNLEVGSQYDKEIDNNGLDLQDNKELGPKNIEHLLIFFGEIIKDYVDREVELAKDDPNITAFTGWEQEVRLGAMKKAISAIMREILGDRFNSETESAIEEYARGMLNREKESANATREALESQFI
jgi:hypothetical protein